MVVCDEMLVPLKSGKPKKRSLFKESHSVMSGFFVYGGL